MAYILKQYNHNSASSPSGFKELITQGGRAKREDEIVQQSISGTNIDIVSVQNEYFEYADGFKVGEIYYLNCSIRRMSSAETDKQIFNVKLAEPEGVNTSTDSDKLEQFIKTISVSNGLPSEQVNFEILFSPVIEGFTRIVFQLQRNVQDYIAPRYSSIVYQEFSIIKTPSFLIDGSNVKELMKVGIQSRPGLMMCINGEEIHTSRSGIFEIRDGVLPITFFSVVSPSVENQLHPQSSNDNPENSSITLTESEYQMWQIGQRSLEIEHDYPGTDIDTLRRKASFYSKILGDYVDNPGDSGSSKNCTNTSKTIVVEPFTLDYIYKSNS